MRNRGAERGLRRAVADLAEMDDAEVQAVLAEFDGVDRARLSALLAACRGVTGNEHSQGSASERPMLSAWLVERFPRPGHGRLTPAAREALLAAARDQGWASSPTSPPAGIRLRGFKRLLGWS